MAFYNLAFLAALVTVGAFFVGGGTLMLACMVLAEWVTVKWFFIICAAIFGCWRVMEWADRKAYQLHVEQERAAELEKAHAPFD